MDLSHLKDGDPVRVFEVNGYNQPEGGWEGKVESVGRRYLVIAFFRNGGSEHEIRVQISDGRSPDQYRRFTVKTPDVADAAVARSEHLRILRSAGITAGAGAKQPTDALLRALADVVDEFGQEATS